MATRVLPRDPLRSIVLPELAGAIERAALSYYKALARGAPAELDVSEIHAALTGLLTLGDLSGRARVLDGLGVPAEFKEIDDFTGPMRDAVDNLVKRHVHLADTTSGVPRYLQVQQFYRDGPAFALSRSTSEIVTDHVRSILDRATRGGIPAKRAEDAIAKVGDFSISYAENVYQTNMKTVQTAGTFEQMKSPAVRSVIAGLVYVSALRGSTRPNHRAMHGTFAPPEDPIWNARSTPCGYRCVCRLDPVTWSKAKQRGYLDVNDRPKTIIPNPSARADPGFGTRPHSVVAA